MPEAAIVIDHDKNNNCHPKRAHVKRNLSSFAIFSYLFFLVFIAFSRPPLPYFFSIFLFNPRKRNPSSFVFIMPGNKVN